MLHFVCFKMLCSFLHGLISVLSVISGSLHVQQGGNRVLLLWLNMMTHPSMQP